MTDSTGSGAVTVFRSRQARFEAGLLLVLFGPFLLLLLLVSAFSDPSEATSPDDPSRGDAWFFAGMLLATILAAAAIACRRIVVDRSSLTERRAPGWTRSWPIDSISGVGVVRASIGVLGWPGTQLRLRLDDGTWVVLATTQWPAFRAKGREAGRLRAEQLAEALGVPFVEPDPETMGP